MKFASRILSLLFFIFSPLIFANDEAFPTPPYPEEALEKNLQGNLVVKVQFDDEGEVDSCQVIKSSGSDFLDDRTKDFVKNHWKNPSFARKTVVAPIIYQPTETVLPKDIYGKTSLEDILLQQGFSKVKGWIKSNSTHLDVEINNKRFDMIMDTGASHSVLTQSSVEDASFNTTPAGDYDEYGVTGRVQGEKSLLKLQNFKIGDYPLVGSSMTVAKIASLGNDGLFGLPTLKENHAVIIVNPPLIFFNSKPNALTQIDGWLRSKYYYAVPLDYAHGAYTLPVKLDGFLSHMLLDTGAGQSLINDEYLKKNNFKQERLNIREEGVDGNRFTAQAVQFHDLAFGSFPFGAEAMTTGSPFFFQEHTGRSHLDGILGHDLLSRSSTVIDTTTDTIYFGKIR